MKRSIVYVLLSGCLCSIGLSSVGQTQGKKVAYSYDAAGNRVLQQPVLVNLQRKKTPVGDTVAIASSLSERKIVVHPNPTKGALAVEIRGVEEASEVTLELFDLSSRLLLSKREKSLYIPLDLSSFKRGVYLLRLTIGKEHLEYKIMKD